MLKDELQTVITALEVAAPDNPLAAGLLDRAYKLDSLDEQDLSSAVAMAHDAFRNDDGELARRVLALVDGDIDEDEEEGL